VRRISRSSPYGLAAAVFLACSVWAACPEGDLDGDCEVSFRDVQTMAEQWLGPFGSEADIDGRNGVEARDFAVLAGDWNRRGIPLVINELMASNSRTLRDPQGQYDDWIELYNAGSWAIDVGGMYVTDNRNNPMLWRIPDDIPQQTTIEPGGYLLIWADGDVEDNGSRGTGLHAGFELAAGGDRVCMFDSDGTTLIDDVEFPDQAADISYGRYPSGSDTWRFFATATPLTANVDAYLGQVSDTKFSHDRGFYDAPFSVTMTTSTEGAQIYYTLDGSSPYDIARERPTGTRYTGSIEINTTTCLRAVAVKPGWKPSNVDTHTYIFPAQVLQQPVLPAGYPSSWGSTTGDYEVDPDIVNHPVASNRFTVEDFTVVPTICITMDRDHWFGPTNGLYINKSLDGTEQPASFQFIDPNNGRDVQASCAMAMQGGVSGGGTSLNRWKVYKLSMRPRFKTYTDNGTPTGGLGKLDFEVFRDSPVESLNTIVLDAVLNNAWNHSGQHMYPMYLQDQYIADLHNRMGGYSPHGFYAHVYINELYWGMYYIHERPDHAWAAEMFGGKKEEYDAIKHNSGSVINHGIGGNATANFNAMLSAASAVAADPTNLAKYETLCGMLDVDNFITYILAHWYGISWDWPQKNWYATHRNHPDGRWRFHTWDAEHSLEYWRLGDNVLGQSPYSIHGMLRASAEYRMRFADHIYKHFFNGGALTYPNTAEMYRARMSQIDRAICGESARWGDRRSAIPHTRADWLAVQELVISDFIQPRWTFLLNYLKGQGLYPDVDPPVFRVNGSYQRGGYISATDSISVTAGPGATVYYTLDGTDPRLPGGAVNSTSVIQAAGPFSLDMSRHIMARARVGTTWSALNEATFAVGPVKQSIRVTEIMYNPKNTGNRLDPNEEFIELKNISSTSVNLNLVRFVNGIDFVFGDVEVPGGGFVLVVRDREAFEAQYPGFSGLVAGEYSGSLDNGGERIKLVDALGQAIADFSYSDGWRAITDGEGFSLTIIDPNDVVEREPGPGLVARWQFDEGSGTTAADSAGANDGTIHGGASWTAGISGGALRFDGVDDYVSVSSVPALASDKVTVEAWVRLEGPAGSWNPILTQHLPTKIGYYFYVYQNKPSFSIIGGRLSPRAISPEAIAQGQWYHLAGTNDGTNMKIYVNGQLKATVNSTGKTGVDHEAVIGFDDAVPAYFEGVIDDIRIYNRALGEEEFQSLSNPTERWNDKDSWRASAYVGGSPGTEDRGIIPDPGAIVINEVLAHSHAFAWDWVELYNTTGADIDIGGWFLSDSRFDQKKYRIAAGTVIPAGGYLVFYEYAHFGETSLDPGRITGFGFSEDGDEAYLRSAEGDVLTGYRTAERFGASATAISFGRYFKRSTGNYNFVPLAYMTPLRPNAYPKVGPIVISEIMYNPDWPENGSYANDAYEYIELRNITTEPVKLYREEKLLPWRFTEGIEFTFPDAPDEVAIPPGECVVVVRNLAAFKWRYPDVPDEKILGPYEGQMANEGERIELSMPGDVDKFGRRHYIMIDRVAFSDGAHPGSTPGKVDLWPVDADGGGKSLTRIIPANYGNDPNNWSAGDPSPGF